MNGLLIFAAAVVVALVLGHQEARHELSLRLRAHRSGLVPPARRPPIPLLEALLAVALGVVLLASGGSIAAALPAKEAGAHPELLRNAAALVLAAGATLVVVGICGVRSFARGCGPDQNACSGPRAALK